ncbi:TetR/AcrR family transcriptional regulator [Streptomyces zagrosensis]|uniref:AcrR family transcriptional regulator n=1 Tax=Streptomyces zagrosensis TaxID=1042984 RepID=A0A7W9QD76_9ACTN|nr:TetR/AcrR family transcriptional regulator [Streptomyces zagrosensis]MBB5938123.1 AcrR family transcriptional regulator [Streptomyces zagrosensis]
MAHSTPRMSADERRSLAVRAAMSEFSKGGYHGTSTEVIARRVGVSQPYLFRLFPNKKALFQAAAAHCFARTTETFVRAADGLHGEAALEAMGGAYSALIVDRELLLMQMQLYVTAGGVDDEELLAYVRQGWQEVWETVRVLSGASGEELEQFFSRGLLINVLVTLGIPGDDRCWATFDEYSKKAATRTASEVVGGPPGSPADGA